MNTRTADQVRAELAAVVDPHGITLQQYNVLRILRGAGPRGLPTLEVAVRMIEKSPGITRLLDRLQAKGLVSRRRCPQDRRQVLCCATSRALSLLGRLDRPMDEAAACALLPLDRRSAARLVRLLDSVRAQAARREAALGSPAAATAAPPRDRRQEKEIRT